MYRFSYSKKLKKILVKLQKKDKLRFNVTLNKIEEIINSKNPHHYKNLSNKLKNYKRVHIDSSFVLIFIVDDNNNIISFEDLQHHDVIYK